jgi:hypothetical protein
MRIFLKSLQPALALSFVVFLWALIESVWHYRAVLNTFVFVAVYNPVFLAAVVIMTVTTYRLLRKIERGNRDNLGEGQ